MPSEQRRSKNTPAMIHAQKRKQRNRILRQQRDEATAASEGISVDELHRRRIAEMVNLRKQHPAAIFVSSSPFRGVHYDSYSDDW